MLAAKLRDIVSLNHIIYFVFLNDVAVKRLTFSFNIMVYKKAIESSVNAYTIPLIENDIFQRGDN